MDIDIVNMRVKYSNTNTNTVSDIKYPDSDMDISEPLLTNSISNMVKKKSVSFSLGLD